MRSFSLIIFVIFLAGLIGCDVPEIEQVEQPSTIETPTAEMPSAEAPTVDETIGDSSSAAADAPKPSSSPDDENSLDDIIAAWRASQEDEALQLLLAVKDNSFAANSSIRVFKLAEEELKDLSRSDVNSIQKEVIDTVKELRGLSRKCLALANEALEQGDIEVARKHYHALGLLGETMTEPQRLVAIKMIGKSFVKSSKEGLSRCEEAASK